MTSKETAPTFIKLDPTRAYGRGVRASAVKHIDMGPTGVHVHLASRHIIQAPGVMPTPFEAAQRYMAKTRVTLPILRGECKLLEICTMLGSPRSLHPAEIDAYGPRPRGFTVYFINGEKLIIPGRHRNRFAEWMTMFYGYEHPLAWHLCKEETLPSTQLRAAC